MDNVAVPALQSPPLPALGIGIGIGLLLRYSVIRVAVARGLRDQDNWLERKRQNSREHVGLAAEAVPPRL
ncbi:hypothetical protein [Microterricola viridarii]|uniref:Uncharacterized protein n=1 Tax=Microterricola viridarii TaxID=412690 RepID=A0A1H1RA13_9MICO|nr:hypothetical protein [Microterricola viridarii]SDS32624.1 hypothetical protein SAMN04489834_1274 [Microterricola viridarii]